MLEVLAVQILNSVCDLQAELDQFDIFRLFVLAVSVQKLFQFFSANKDFQIAPVNVGKQKHGLFRCVIFV